MSKKGNFYSMIDARIHVSESEIAVAYPDYHCNWLYEETDKLKGILYDLGLDTNLQFELQEVTQHKNRLNQTVTCARYMGSERLDAAWINSGLASQAAKDKVKNCSMLDDMYRCRGLTIDAQLALESKDKYELQEDQDNL